MCMHAACMDNLWERQIFLYIDMTPFEKAKLLETFNTIYLWVSLSPVSIMYENLSSISKHNSKSGGGCDGCVSECPYQSCQTAASSSGSARLYLDFYSLHNVLSDVCFSSAINIQAPPPLWPQARDGQWGWHNRFFNSKRSVQVIFSLYLCSSSFLISIGSYRAPIKGFINEKASVWPLASEGVNKT